VLQWLPNVEFSGLWWGIEHGDFEQNGVVIDDYLPWAPGVDPMILVASGEYEFGVNDGAAVVIARSRGLPLKCVYASFQMTPFGFATLQDRPDGRQLTRMEDLGGLIVGYQSHELYLLEHMLAEAGMTLEDVTPVEVGFDPTLLVVGEVDAFLVYKSNEPISLHLHGVETYIIDAADYGFDFYGGCLFTTDKMIEEHPEVVRGFVQAFRDGWVYANEHPFETVDMVIGKYFTAESADPVARLNHAVHQQGEMLVFQQQSQGDLASLDELGSMTAERWQRGIDILYEQGQIDSRPDVSVLFTNEFLELEQ